MPQADSTSPPRSDAIAIGQEISHYRIVGRLGAGGMGEVWAADDLNLKRRVALKALFPGTVSDPLLLHRFEREAEAIAALSHPNIVTIYSIDEHCGLRFFTMELVDGKTLKELIPAGGMELERFFEIALPLTDALVRAHAGGVVHRDVKPANIMVGADGLVKVLDFGLAKLKPEEAPAPVSDADDTASYELTKAGAVVGTAPYMSPEQLLGASIDHRSDIWSLAVVLHEMLAGHHPFRDGGSASIHAILTRDPEPLTSAPASLAQVLRMALAKQPKDRFALMADMMQALLRVKRELQSGSGHLILPFPFGRDEAEPEEPERPLFVARERELARLRELLESTLAGEGRVAFVTGDAGSGKTTLMWELARRAQEDLPELVVAGGTCNAHTGLGDPYLPFRETLGLLTGDIAARWRAGAITREQAIALWGVLPLTIEAVLAEGPGLIGTLLPGSALLERARLATNTAEWLDALETVVERRWAGSPQQSDLFAQYTRVLHELARQRPLLLLIDDLQWADAGSISLLFHLGRQLRGSRLLVLGAYRTAEVAAGRADQRHPLERVVNELKRDRGDCEVPVAAAEDRRFVDELLDAEPNRLDESFRTALFRQARGHPLFTVELLRSLREEGGLVRDADGRWVESGPLDWGRLPMRVEAAIAERLGRLPEELCRLLTVASVQGESFTAEVVARLHGIDEAEAARRLSVELDKRHRLVRALGLRRLGEQRLSRYAFRHILFQRYLYEQLDPIERSHLHEGVGNALLGIHGDQREEIAVELAQHFELAGLPSRAVEFLHLAGQSAARVSAHQEAISHLTRALNLLEEKPGSPERTQRQVEVLTALGPSLIAIRGYAAAEVERVYLRSRELCRELGEEQQQFWALWGLWVFHHVRADLEEAFELARQLMRLAELGDDPVYLVEALSALGLSHVERGEIILARRRLERAVALSPRHLARSISKLTGEDVEVASLSFLACALWIEGFPDQAVKRSQEALDLARRLRHPFSQAFALNFVVYAHLFRREPEIVGDRAAELIELSAERDFPFWHGLGTVCLLWAQAHEDHDSDAERDEILAGIRRAIDAVAASGARISQTLLLAYLAAACLRYGRIEAAREALETAFAVLEATGERHTEAELYRLRGELAATARDPGGQPEADFRRAIAIAREQGARSWELRAAVSLSRLLESEGRQEEARVDLAAVTRRFTEGFDTRDFLEARALLSGA